jgi:UDP:flavonoid glycosyltransferase YjiC (YdhE family)
MTDQAGLRIALTVVGARGDVQPFIALGAGLRARGHHAILCAPPAFEPLAAEAGLEFRPVLGGSTEFFEIPAVVEALRKGPSMLRAMRAMPRPDRTRFTAELASVREASQGADLVVTSLVSRNAALSDPDTPWVASSWWPTLRTGTLVARGFPDLGIGAGYNRLTHRLFERADWQMTKPYINDLRRSHGVPPLTDGAALRSVGTEIPALFPFSPTLLPPPADWPANCHVTGYWFWDRQKTPSRETVALIEDGRPPLVITFGSTWAVHRQEDTLAMAVQAARQAGRRLVLVDGPTHGLPDDAIRLHDADYQWLFPRAAAVVHHCGFGTAASAALAGVPQVSVPTFAEQPLWADLLTRNGVSPQPLPFAKLRHEKFVAAVVTACDDPAMRAAARDLGGRIQAERGVENACEVLESYARGVVPAREVS